jgi:hypothetical protein
METSVAILQNDVAAFKGVFSIDEVVNLYRATFNNPEGSRKYLSYARGYMLHCVEKKTFIHQISLTGYLAQLSGNRSVESVLRKFLTFCQQSGIQEVTAGNRNRFKMSKPKRVTQPG